MLINVISLKRRNDRRLSLIEHLEGMNCLYRFWDGMDDRKVMPFININASHRMVVQDAKDRGLECVLIAEDDLRFSSKKSLEVFINSVPESYHLFFGVIYSGTIQDKRIVHGFSGMQLYLIHHTFFDVFLSVNPKKHIDSFLGESCHLYNYHVCDPFICAAASGYSNNFLRQWTFDEKKLPRQLLKDDL